MGVQGDGHLGEKRPEQTGRGLGSEDQLGCREAVVPFRVPPCSSEPWAGLQRDRKSGTEEPSAHGVPAFRQVCVNEALTALHAADEALGAVGRSAALGEEPARGVQLGASRWGQDAATQWLPAHRRVHLSVAT